MFDIFRVICRIAMLLGKIKLMMWGLGLAGVITFTSGLSGHQHYCVPGGPHFPHAVQASAQKAQQLMAARPYTVPIQDRIAVMVLFSHGFVESPDMEGRLKWLQCSLLKLQRNLLHNNSADIFIWTLNTTTVVPVMPTWLNARDFPNVYVMDIEPITWKIPCGLAPDSTWAVRDKFSIDYYLMGRWRLTFSLDFAREMGYEYHLQFDDDAILHSKIETDLIELWRRRDKYMGVFPDQLGEVPQVVLGLPELARYWVAVRGFQISGEIFQHTNPPNINGLTTTGWDRMYNPGYFMMVSIRFWFSPDTQDFLDLIFKTGRDIEGRWQEQAVMNMIRLIMVPHKRLYALHESDIGHDRNGIWSHGKDNFQPWCCDVMPNLSC